MADFTLLSDGARLYLTGIFAALATSPVYLGFTAFLAWILPPLLHCRVRIKAEINGKLRKLSPGIQTYLPKEVCEYLRQTNKCGRMARVVWVCITIAFIFAPNHNVPITLIVCAFMWFATGGLWNIPSRWIKQNRCWWQLEDERRLAERKDGGGRPLWQLIQESKQGKRTENGKTNRVNHIEWHFWKVLMDCRIPHIYQLQIPTPDARGNDNRYIDFAFLDPKTGEPVLGIETDECHHFADEYLLNRLCNRCRNLKSLAGNQPNDDFDRELEILKESGIPIHRVPAAYWFRGLAPDDMKYPEDIAKNQRRLLRIALEERDTVVGTHKEKRKAARMNLKKRPSYLRRLWRMCTGM